MSKSKVWCAMWSAVIWGRGMQKCVTTKFTLTSCVTVSSYMTLEAGPYQTNKILPRRRSGGWWCKILFYWYVSDISIYFRHQRKFRVAQWGSFHFMYVLYIFFKFYIKKQNVYFNLDRLSIKPTMSMIWNQPEHGKEWNVFVMRYCKLFLSIPVLLSKIGGWSESVHRF